MTAVDKIAELICDAYDDGVALFADRAAEAVVAAIKAMSPSELAELIGGSVQDQPAHHCPARCCHFPSGSRVVGPWIAD